MTYTLQSKGEKKFLIFIERQKVITIFIISGFLIENYEKLFRFYFHIHLNDK
jgi:hypothetical protein